MKKKAEKDVAKNTNRSVVFLGREEEGKASTSECEIDNSSLSVCSSIIIEEEEEEYKDQTSDEQSSDDEEATTPQRKGNRSSNQKDRSNHSTSLHEGNIRSQNPKQHRDNKREIIIMDRQRNGPLSRSQSTPKLERSLLARSTELIKEMTPSPSSSSMEYSYYVIASPMVGRRKTSSTTSLNTLPDMSNRSYSFVSMSSSKDSLSSSDVTGATTSSTTVVQQSSKRRAPKSRGLLQSIKDKLLAEIENINVELIKMDSEKLVLVNLRNSSLLYRNMICKSERNNQGIPNAAKLRATCESIELKIQDEEHALQDDLSIPSIDDIRKDLKAILKVCNVITGNGLSSSNKTSGTNSSTPNSTKSTLSGNNMNKMTLVEELLCAVAKLYGVVDTILVIFYEDLTEDEDVGDDEVVDETPDMVDSGVECKEDSTTSSPSPELAVDVSLIFSIFFGYNC